MNTKNYPNWLINVGQAKKLKEIGFDEPCEFSLPIKQYEDFDINELNFDFQKENHNDSFDKWSIPTYEQVFEWFREKGFVSFIKIDNQSMFDEGCYYCYVISNERGKTIDCKSDFDDYKEAREALVKALIQTYNMLN